MAAAERLVFDLYSRILEGGKKRRRHCGGAGYGHGDVVLVLLVHVVCKGFRWLERGMQIRVRRSGNVCSGKSGGVNGRGWLRPSSQNNEMKQWRARMWKRVELEMYKYQFTLYHYHPFPSASDLAQWLEGQRKALFSTSDNQP